MTNKRLIMYTNRSSRQALWMYGPLNSDNVWKVLTSTDNHTIISSFADFDMMSQSHCLINSGGPDTDELVQATKFLMSTHGKKQAG